MDSQNFTPTSFTGYFAPRRESTLLSAGHVSPRIWEITINSKESGLLSRFCQWTRSERENDTKLLQNIIKELHIFSASKTKLDVKHRALIIGLGGKLDQITIGNSTTRRGRHIVTSNIIRRRFVVPANFEENIFLGRRLTRPSVVNQVGCRKCFEKMWQQKP